MPFDYMTVPEELGHTEPARCVLNSFKIGVRTDVQSGTSLTTVSDDSG